MITCQVFYADLTAHAHTIPQQHISELTFSCSPARHHGHLWLAGASPLEVTIQSMYAHGVQTGCNG